MCCSLRLVHVSIHDIQLGDIFSMLCIFNLRLIHFSRVVLVPYVGVFRFSQKAHGFSSHSRAILGDDARRVGFPVS